MATKLLTALGGGVTLEAANTATDKTLTLPADNGTVVYANSSGNVGIGTSSPTSLLHVYGGSGTNIGVQSSAGRSWKLGDGVGSTDGYFVIYDYSAAAKRLELDTNGNLKFNSGYGSVTTAYGCRAWVNFNGTGTVAIRGSGNVSSITDNGTGDYTVNFSSAMPDANYAPDIAITKAGANTSSGGIAAANVSSAPTLMSTTQLRVVAGSDANVCAVSIFR